MSSQNPPPSEGDVWPEGEPDPFDRPTTFAEVLAAATPVVWVTPTIVVVNVAVFVLMVATGVSPISPTTADLFKWGADFGPATVLDGQWWRLLSAAFLHVGVLHIALNMYVFWGAGTLAERLYGNVAYLLLYLVAALGGSLVSTLWSPLAVSAGASGAIFGVYGAILAFARRAGGQLPPPVVAGLQKGVTGFIVYNLAFGLTVPNISNSAHLGGLATGFLAGWLLARDLATRGRPEATRYLRLAGLVPVLAALAWGVHHRVSGLPSGRSGRLAEDAAAIALAAGESQRPGLRSSSTGGSRRLRLASVELRRCTGGGRE